MKTCRNCNTDILNKENVFCSKSCAATYNNKLRTQESRDKQRESVSRTLKFKFSLIPKVPKVKPKDIRDPNLIPLKKVAIRKYTGIFLKKDPNYITYDDVELFKECLIHELWVNKLTPQDINIKLEMNHSGFDMFIRKCLDLKVPTHKERGTWAKEKYNEHRTEREIYYSKCKFNFDPYAYPQLPGFELLKDHSFYHPVTNKNGLTRDHMISRNYGWENKIDPSLLAHPANCALMFMSENASKNNRISLTLEELKERIVYWEIYCKPVDKHKYQDSVKITRSEEYRKKISKTGKQLRNYTNGTKNIRIRKDLPIPNGYTPGMVRKKKMVRMVVLETTGPSF